MKEYKLATSSWDSKEISAINKVISSGHYTMSKNVFEFEKKYAEYVGSKYCVMVNSGSSANLIGVGSLFYTKTPKLKRGDEVIVPSVSWATTYHPLHQYGLKIKFVDIDLNTLNYDLDSLSKAISKKTKMIVAVDLLGNPNDYDQIKNIIGDKNIILFQDSCESMGAEFNGKKVGTQGIIGTFSTFFSHHIATMEGGMVVTDDEELYHILISLRAHGWTRGLPENNKILKLKDPFYEAFNFILPGYNVRPIEMSGAIGLEQLKKLPQFVINRRKNAEIFKKLFKDNTNVIIQKELGNSSWFGFSFIIKNSSKFSRSDLIKKFNEKNIECRPIVSGDFTKNEVIKYYDYSIFGELKNSNLVHENGIFIGNHPFDISNELNYVKQIFDELSK